MMSCDKTILNGNNTKVVILPLLAKREYRSTLDQGSQLNYKILFERLSKEYHAISTWFQKNGLCSEIQELSEDNVFKTKCDVDNKIQDLCFEPNDFNALILCVLGISMDKEVLSLDEPVTVDQIIQPLSEHPRLAKKPKIFIFQVFHGITTANTVYSQNVQAENERIPVDADVFVADASIPHNWTGNTMASILANIGNSGLEICRIFTKVNEETINDKPYMSFLDSQQSMETSLENRKELPVTHFWSTLRDFIYIKNGRE